jgi:biopolymer transport protein TolR
MAGNAQDRGPRALKADINVTPLVDVVLVLLIIFMVITPLIRQSHPVQLPAARAGAPASAKVESLVLTIGADQKLWLGDEALAVAQLGPALSARHGRAALLIKADSSLSMRELRPLLSQIKAAGLSQIAFAVAPKQGAR